MIKKIQLPERKQKKRELQQQLSLFLMVLTVFLAMVIPLLSTHSSGSGLKDLGTRYTEGELSSEDIFATSSFQYIDDEQTQKLIEQRMQEVLPYFSYSLRSSTVSSRRLEKFLALFHQGNTDFNTFLEKEGISDEHNVVGRIVGLSPEQQQLLLQALEETGSYVLERGLFDEEEVNTVRSQGYGELLVRNSLLQQESSEPSLQTMDTLLTKKNLPTQLTARLEPYEFINSQFQPYLVLDALEMLLDPNVDYEAVETLALREEAAAEIPEQVITIERGEKIIAKDTVVTSSQIDLLQLMGSNSFQYTILELIGRAIFILLSTSVSVYVFIQFLHAEKRLYLYLNLMLVSVSLSLVAMYVVSLFFTSRSSLFLDSYLPVLFAPLFTSHITSKKRLGLVSAFLLACYATLMEQSSSVTFFFVLTISGVCLYFFRYTIKRIDDVFNWFYACVISSFAALALYMLEALPLHQVMPLVGGMILNITITLVFLEAFVPLGEKLFNIPTAYRLSELAFSASPVLDRLESVAQGTFNHSRNVADLSFNAARSIGANAMLARVGGMYHDIGKADHPEYFIENQSGDNKHDEIKPSLSAAIIKSHVKLGLEKGREAGLPQEVLDIISQHHGNDIIQFFYNEAKNQAQAAGIDVKEDDFKYNGNPPAFPESAIVMLADCVEAASRTLKRPNHSKYEKLVHSLIMGKLERDQLKNSQLSLTDLDQIEDAFVQTLLGRDHRRIEYPSEQKG